MIKPVVTRVYQANTKINPAKMVVGRVAMVNIKMIMDNLVVNPIVLPVLPSTMLKLRVLFVLMVNTKI